MGQYKFLASLILFQSFASDFGFKLIGRSGLDYTISQGLCKVKKPKLP